MSPPGAAKDDFFSGAPPKPLLGAWWRFAVRLYRRRRVALGQVATTVEDESLYLLLRTLGLPLESPKAVLQRLLTPEEEAAVRAMLRRRLVDRVPAAYLTKEAWLGEHRFYVDERVIIPRSYFLEIVPQLGLGNKRLRLADVCTGSGCLAILLAHQFPHSQVDAIDLSGEALEVARINVREHGLERRVTLHRSDVFDDVIPVKYDLILSNPPYEPSARMKRLAPEFRQEPRLALDGGADGLDVIRKLLRQARTRLQGDGLLLIEVGGLRSAMKRAFPWLEPRWFSTEDGSDCVCGLAARNLEAQGLAKS